MLERASALAAAALGALCQELRGVSPDRPTVPEEWQQRPPAQLELFRSPVASAEAPLGVRSVSTVTPGQLLCFYPGRLFAPTEQALPKSDMLYSNEYEGVYLDGKGWLPMEWRGHPLLEKHAVGAIWHGNRLAVGNLLNHPPRNQLPNCVPVAFRWPSWQELQEETPAYWARLVPHVEVQAGQVVRTASGVVQQRQEGTADADAAEGRVWFPPWPHMGVGLFAIRQIQPGDELYWNYRLHPRADSAGAAKYPEWYHSVDDEELEEAIAAQLAASKQTEE